MKRVVIGLVTVALAMPWTTPAVADDGTWATYEQMLDDISTFSRAAWSGPGLEVTQHGARPAKSLLDFTSGYVQLDNQRMDWAGTRYRPVKRSADTKQALRYIGANEAQWVASDTGSSYPQLLDVPAMPSVWEVYQESPLKAPATAVREQSDAVVTYRLTEPAVTVTIAPTWMTRTTERVSTTWRLGAFPVSPPDPATVIDRSDMDSAKSALRMTRHAKRAIRKARRVHSVGALRRIADTAGFVRAGPIRGGAKLIAHNRYVHRVWTMRLIAGEVRVTSSNRHPASWTPPRRRVRVPEPRPAAPVNREAALLLDEAAIRVQQEKGVRMTVTLRSELSSIVLVDFVNGLSAFAAPNGTPALVRDANEPGTTPIECGLIARADQLIRRALRLAGSPGATWGCSRQGDTDLAWASFFPVLFMLRLQPTLLQEPGVTVTREGDFTQVTTQEDVFTLTGSTLTSTTSGEPAEALNLSMQYGPQPLQMPAMATRVPSRRLDAAIESLEARKVVRDNARALRACAIRRIDRGRSAQTAITSCAQRLRTRYANFNFTEVRAGVRVAIRNRYGADSRDVVVSPDAQAVRIIRVIHVRNR